MTYWFSSLRPSANDASVGAALRIQTNFRRLQASRTLKARQDAATVISASCRAYLANTLYARRAAEDRLWDVFEHGDAARTTKPLVENGTASVPGTKKKMSALGLMLSSLSLLLTALSVTQSVHIETKTNLTTIAWLEPTRVPEAVHELPDRTCTPKGFWEMGVIERRLLVGLFAKGQPDVRAPPLARAQMMTWKPLWNSPVKLNAQQWVAEVAVNAAHVTRALVRSCAGWLRRLLSKAAAELSLSKERMGKRVSDTHAALQEWHTMAGTKIAEEMIIA